MSVPAHSLRGRYATDVARVAFVVLSLSVASHAKAQGARPVGSAVISGTVADTNLRGIAGADVQVIGTESRLSADAAGRFSFLQVPPGDFLIWVRRLGYRPVSTLVHIEHGDTIRLALTMEPTFTDLAPVVVTEKKLSPRMREFDERRRAGFGHFMTQAEIDKFNFVDMAAVMRTFMSVRVEPDKTGGGHIAANMRARCRMPIYVDGLPRNEKLELLPTPKEIAAIEVYSGPATVPPNYGKGSCGLILIWTRDQ